MWYDLVTAEMASTKAGSVTVDAPLTVIPVFIRGGAILPWQYPALNTVERWTGST